MNGGIGVCVWREDADSIRFEEDALDIVYQNPIIREYLHSNRKLGIAGTKGQGKTFLLKVKRKGYQGSSSDGSSVVCFPKNLMVDTLDSSISIMGTSKDNFVINHSLKKQLKNFNVWVQLWKLSIAICIIGSDEFKHLFSDKDYQILNKLSQQLIEVENVNVRPSIIFFRLLKLDYNDFMLVMQDAALFMQLLDKINCAIYFFIDKVDQAFSEEIYKIAQAGSTVYSKNSSYWQYAQYSLAAAAYEIFSNVNSHIKVFYTIRHEALIDTHRIAPNTARNIEAFISELVYTQDDIFEMFSIYVVNEKKENLSVPREKHSNPEKAFFGFDKIKHAYVADTNESIFAYLYRHSLRRPYDVMKICRELYLKNPCRLNVTIVRHTINDISNKVLKTYLSEMEPFIVCKPKDIDRLLQCMNTNFFDFKYIQYVCQRYNKFISDSDVCLKNCQMCKNAHPFSTLYNIGLIGCIKNSAANPIYTQQYAPIGESRLKINEYDLPDSPLYCLHPCLCDVSRKLRGSIQHTFTTTNEAIAGEGIQILDEQLKNIQKELPERIRELDSEKIFVSSTVLDLSNERRAISQSLFKMGYYPILSESEEFEYGPNDTDSHDHCINEVLKCTQIIFIVGEKYGGIYAGTKYQELAATLCNASEGRITKPSISLMELFAAITNGLQYYVFVKKSVLEQQRLYKENGDSGAVDKEIFSLINFINHIQKNGERAGNWFVPFKSITDLNSRLRSICIH